MARQEWRARANLTGDPVKDRETREAMLDALHASMVRSQRAAAESNARLRGNVEAVVGEPVREIESDDDGEEA